MSKLFKVSNTFKPKEKDNPDLAWAKSFLILPVFWDNQDYLDSCVIKPNSNYYNMNIFYKSLKNYYTKLVEKENYMSGNDLRRTISVMVNYKIYLKEENIIKTYKEIMLGIHNTFLNELQEEIDKYNIQCNILEDDKQENDCSIDEIEWGLLL